MDEECSRLDLNTIAIAPTYSRGGYSRSKSARVPVYRFLLDQIDCPAHERASSKWHADFQESESISSILRYSTSSHLSYVTTASPLDAKTIVALPRI